MRKISLLLATFVLSLAFTGCGSDENVTPDDVKPETNHRLNPEQIAPAFTKGENAMPASATTCMGNVIYKSDISDDGVQIIAEWDGESATGLSTNDLAIFQSEEIAVAMTKCLQAVTPTDQPSSKPDSK